MANSGVAGYVGGGVAPATATVEKFAFPSDTRSIVGTGLSIAKFNLAAMSSSGVL
jgi:hypothetical protein